MCESHKKHISQMKKSEVDLIKSRLENLGTLELSFHVKEQMIKRNISKKDMCNVLKSYWIIEFHHKINDYGKADNRVLVRSKRSVHGSNTCLSISLDKARVITCYSNESSDKHSTIDIKQYIKREKMNRRRLDCYLDDLIKVSL